MTDIPKKIQIVHIYILLALPVGCCSFSWQDSVEKNDNKIPVSVTLFSPEIHYLYMLSQCAFIGRKIK